MNIKDVAVLAGVSPATVSRFVNTPESVASATAQKIERVIDTTGYRIDRKSHALEFNKNPTIGVLIPSLLNPVFSEVVAGIQQRARHFGYSTIVLDTQYDSEQEQQAAIDLIRQRVEGVILTIADVSDNAALELLRSFKFPYCLLHNQSVENEPCVYVDNYQAGKDVAQKILEYGHIKIGMITGHFASSDRAKKRYEGFKQGLYEKGVELSQLLEVDQNKLVPFTDSEMSLLSGECGPTVWFCSNDLLALKTMNALKSTGRRIPQDVSVVGFDGMGLGQLVSPNLATVAVPHIDMGKMAVDILFNAKAGSIERFEFALKYELQMKGSLGAVPVITQFN
ncbi:substrate-binding domain-containing protein [Vibrio sp. Sgm 22]|uniref:substrate-binding domain-containing protein n=1 Tax=Vibrio TaxID=662 RepID=UPI002055C8CB|nr:MULTISPECIES: substrate-binding domain-containing protein [Vibrio]MCX2761113.1 substrate-binding domain-containing protein [Vibrio sp. 14G-20]MCX2778037.1 substrate-binding domain-containing protein [Vibrio sp. Sgm 22]UPR49363.1 substrate-binding domain-containing protein [Vibrio cyclitrophicus]UXA00339.1 substrate-binding domain-containing protein [Vibrio splendidus]